MSPESRLFCRLDSMPGSEGDQQRLLALQELGLLEAESVPIFEETTQTAAHFLDAPICILGVMDHDRQLFKSAVGLSRVGLMNDLAYTRQLPRQESFCTYVVDSHQVLVVPDAMAHPAFVNSLLVQRYGIRAYLGVPLRTSSGHCLGTLAIMELKPRQFNEKDIEFLELTARWCMSEFERNHLLKQAAVSSSLAAAVTHPTPDLPDLPVETHSAFSSIKVNLISQMTQELRTPLTSILGMASVLSRGIYGALTDKQKEYINIVHNSGQYLLSLVNEILEVGGLDDSDRYLDLSPVDVEMLCQQALNTLEQAAKRRDQQIRLTVEPGPRIWLVDKDKVRQLLYHLIFSVIQSSSADSIIRIHVSRKQKRLNFTVWTSHPWMGDGLPPAEISSSKPLMVSVAAAGSDSASFGSALDLEPRTEEHYLRVSPNSITGNEAFESSPSDQSRQCLGLMLSCKLAEMHGGQISLQGSIEAGYRYVISLPQLTDPDNL